MTGKDGDTEEHIHIYMMQVRKTHAFMNCRCGQDKWKKYRKVFEKMVENAK